MFEGRERQEKRESMIEKERILFFLPFCSLTSPAVRAVSLKMFLTDWLLAVGLIQRAKAIPDLSTLSRIPDDYILLNSV